MLNLMLWCNGIKKQQQYIANNYPDNKEILNWKYTEENT